MNDVHEVLVIGAGPAGLATSRELSRWSVPHVVIERGREVGQTWADLYDSLVLHTTRRLSALPGLAFPWGTPRFPTRMDVLAYLRDYARTFALPLRLGLDVVDLRRMADVWLARTAAGGEVAARSVVVATGIVSSPHVPGVPGRERFNGRVIHSAEYRRPEPFLGQRVLVVGAGNSAADIAVDLARARVDVTLAVRSGATVVPLHIAGIPIQYLGLALGALPRQAQALATSAVRKASRALGRGAVLPPGSSKPCAGIPVIGWHLSEALRAGVVHLKGGIAELTATGARFHDGSTVPIDAVILATGYRAAVGFLRDGVRLDDCGFPVRVDQIASADQPDLYFVGHRYDFKGGLYNISRDATLAAARIRSGLGDRRRTPTERRQPHNER